jgi:FMN phosphatase YigB (HAD superfamily)
MGLMSGLSFSGYIFDLDGTIYRGEKLIPGARETIERLKSLSKRIVFLSNKPIQTRGDYASKLTRLGIPTQPDEVINSTFVMAHYLKKSVPRARLFEHLSFIRGSTAHHLCLSEHLAGAGRERARIIDCLLQLI